MPEAVETRSLAVLIDADNTSAKHAQAIFDEIVKLGEANVRRIYGDFSHGRLAAWDKAIQSLAILQHQQRSNSKAARTRPTSTSGRSAARSMSAARPTRQGVLVAQGTGPCDRDPGTARFPAGRGDPAVVRCGGRLPEVSREDIPRGPRSRRDRIGQQKVSESRK